MRHLINVLRTGKCNPEDLLISSLSYMQSTRVAVPEIQLSMFFLNFTALAEGTIKIDDQLVSRSFQAIFHGDSV